MSDDAKPTAEPHAGPHSGPLAPGDPFGDRAWQAAKRAGKKKQVEADVEAYIDPAVKAVAASEARKEAKEKFVPGDVSAIDLPMSEELFDDRILAIDAEIRDEEDAKWDPDDNGLPPMCPARPLGKNKFTFYFLNHQHEIIAMNQGDMGQGGIDALFAGATGFLYWAWPRRSTKNRSGVAYDVVRKNLMDGCARVTMRSGIFDESTRVRGRGAWKDSKGKLIMHLGDAVIVDGKAEKPGVYDAMVYPGGPSMARPATEAKDLGRDAGALLFKLLKGWKWKRGDLDALLALGFIGHSYLGGALDWRSHIVVHGPRGSGKSALMGLIGQAIGSGLVKMEEASAPYIYQTLKFDSLPVVLDEFENDDGSMTTNVLRLVTRSSSGGKIGRGGQDGVPVNYTIRSSFAVSAIVPPPLLPAEASRVAMLGLLPHGGQGAPAFTPEQAAQFQGCMRGRAIQYWPIWPEILGAFKNGLAKAGHEARACDQFGTLLAGAWLALHDGVPNHLEVGDWCGVLDPSSLAETMGGRAGWRRCLDHLFAAQPDLWRNKSDRAVGGLLDRFLHATEPPSLDATRNQLGEAGLALVARERVDGSYKKDFWLAVPDEHSSLAKLFEGSTWAARRGAPGAWGRALEELPPHAFERGRFRFGGSRVRGVLINLGAVVDQVNGETVFVSSLDAPNEFMGDKRG
jgi:hypothetical protein